MFFDRGNKIKGVNLVEYDKKHLEYTNRKELFKKHSVTKQNTPQRLHISNQNDNFATSFKYLKKLTMKHPSEE